MRTNCPSTVEMPTIEECRHAALVIDDDLLRTCVQRQCSDIHIECAEWVRRECKEAGMASGSAILAFTYTTYHGTLHSFFPVKETHWCEESASLECVTNSLVHELAHSCGWKHEKGNNVPGKDSTANSIPACR